MWRNYLTELCPDCVFSSPASETLLAEIEHTLGLSLPDDLTDLLQESDGVAIRSNQPVSPEQEELSLTFPWHTDEPTLEYLWSASDILHRNQEYRAPDFAGEYLSRFTRSIFFASSPTGNPIAFETIEGNQAIIEWDHETWEYRLIARSLREFLEQNSAPYLL